MGSFFVLISQCSFLWVFCVCCFFFFKQKTAYEMRISDWSSDVCSSDLLHADADVAGAAGRGGDDAGDQPAGSRDHRPEPHRRAACLPGEGGGARQAHEPVNQLRPSGGGWMGCGELCPGGAEVIGDAGSIVCGLRGGRSEEHTSELQSLMRISYAVFCLKKK